MPGSEQFIFRVPCRIRDLRRGDLIVCSEEAALPELLFVCKRGVCKGWDPVRKTRRTMPEITHAMFDAPMAFKLTSPLTETLREARIKLDERTLLMMAQLGDEGGRDRSTTRLLSRLETRSGMNQNLLPLFLSRAGRGDEDLPMALLALRMLQGRPRGFWRTLLGR